MLESVNFPLVQFTALPLIGTTSPPSEPDADGKNASGITSSNTDASTGR
jgi:hypothetical protein